MTIALLIIVAVEFIFFLTTRNAFIMLDFSFFKKKSKEKLFLAKNCIIISTNKNVEKLDQMFGSKCISRF